MSLHVPSTAPMTEVRGCLVVTLHSDMDDADFAALQHDFSQRLLDKRLHGAIFNFSGVQVMDLHEFARVRTLTRVAGFLGVGVVLAALSPGIAAFLAQADMDIRGMQFSQQLEDAFAQLTLDV